MPKTRGIPDPLRRRHLIEQTSDPAASLALAEAYLAEGRSPEAIAFLVKAGADDRLAALVEETIEAGDAFLLKQIADATGSDPGTERWLTAAERAEAAGKHRYAEMARRHARSSGQ
jgi:hypothetical protein